MKNEYGATLDRNGYANSIIPFHDENTCFLCGGNGRGKMDRHEVFGGAYRDKSKRLGLWVHLCHDPCHMKKAHGDGKTERGLRYTAQSISMELYGWSVDDFRREFGKSYLEIPALHLLINWEGNNA